MKAEIIDKKTKAAAISILFTELIDVALLALIFIVPLYSEIDIDGYKITHYMMKGESGAEIAYVGIAFLVVYLVCLIFTSATISYFINNKQKFVKMAKASIYICLFVSLLYFIAGYVFQTLMAYSTDGTANSSSYIPFIVLCVPTIVFSILEGLFFSYNPLEKSTKKRKKYRFEPLLYVLLFTGGTASSLFVSLIKMDVTAAEYSGSISITGLKLLQDYAGLGSGYQLLAFVMITIYIISAIGLVLTLAGFFSKSNEYQKIARATSYINVFFIFMIAVSGLYFMIGQKMNEDNLLTVLAYYGVDGSFEYSYVIYSEAIYALIGDVVVLGVMIARNAMLKYHDADINVENALVQAQLDAEQSANGNAGAESASDMSESQIFEPSAEGPAPTETAGESSEINAEKTFTSIEELNFDPCPAFSELDAKAELFIRDLELRKSLTVQSPTLSSIAQFVVDYARESRLHLSYSKADIATFIAGLGASRLTILQGMSGTGKTSLPKIFSEAICGVCDIVEVESSWKDKNELLGYYNEFSKTYTPKKFTYNLYKAALNSQVPTFIVLDEMNLSRIEYYFSDFLSIMEHEEHKRKIKLLNVTLKRTVNGEKFDYLELGEGHTLNVPINVWFIGTANRDESTFEISDKVYDRAQTMNFNKRAPKVRNFNSAISQSFVSYPVLSSLLKKANEEGDFDAENNKLIKSVEEILLPFNISFGNRILNQMESFVNIYCKCFEGENVVDAAIEKILLSKVVSKLEVKIIENKDVLIRRFEELGLLTCADFVSKLNED